MPASPHGKTAVERYVAAVQAGDEQTIRDSVAIMTEFPATALGSDVREYIDALYAYTSAPASPGPRSQECHTCLER